MNLTTLDLSSGGQCNLNCSFCYAQRTNVQMSDTVVSAVIGWLRQNKRDRRPLNLNWTANGEPMMRADWLLKTVHRIRRALLPIPTTSGFNTNCTLLTEDWLREWILLNGSIMLSVDGPPDVQQALRGTDPDLIESKIRLAQRFGFNKVRATVVPTSLDSILETTRYLWALGVSHIHHVPAFEMFEDASIPSMRAQVAAIAGWVRDRYLAGRRPRISIIDQGWRAGWADIPPRKGPVFPCAAGRTMAAINEIGDFYPCHRFLDDPDCYGGSVYDGVDLRQWRWFTHHNPPPECRDCIAFPLCKGGCYWVRRHGGINAFHCAFKRACVLEARRIWDELVSCKCETFRKAVVAGKKWHWPQESLSA